MNSYDKIGSVFIVDNASEGRFAWTIPNFKQLFRVRANYWMPECFLLKSSWELGFSTISPYCQVYGISITLFQGSEEAGTVNYTLEFKRSNGVDEKIVTHKGVIGKNHSYNNGCNLFFKSEDLTPYDIFTIICTLKREENHVVTGGSISSCATQTEVPDIVTDKENISRSEESSSFDTKGFTHLSEHMKQLFISGNDYDLKICVKNKEFPVHRNIIKARSPGFASMLSDDTTENNTGAINVDDCDPEAFDEFLIYLYSGKTENLTPSKALNLYYIAKKYDIPILKEQCVNILKTSFSVTSICSVVVLAAKHEEKELLQAAKDYFVQNHKEILATVEWQRFLSENPVEANELYISNLEILLDRN